ncbi:RHTO0S12e05732g1_1 [Rhodotorula toruloides]|uniref:mannan endo-1,4-beta-mannosidase n=1 Tax=Rhodotorula toruloides TaxID=5286 RepID=A0A061BHT5_RHOTO|nr:RHTO0S12e05732g1_1 [Rhodotorula toruloides]
MRVGLVALLASATVTDSPARTSRLDNDQGLGNYKGGVEHEADLKQQECFAQQELFGFEQGLLVEQDLLIEQESLRHQGIIDEQSVHHYDESLQYVADQQVLVCNKSPDLASNHRLCVRLFWFDFRCYNDELDDYDMRTAKTTNSNKLTLDGSPFTIVGPNIFWLCQDYGPIGNYTDKAMVREALAMAVALGANTIRALSCGISTGTAGGTNPYSLEPTRGTFNNAAWDIRDYVLYAAKQYGLRVILTLTDNYAYYHGGKYDFLNWRNVSTANKGAAFYTNKAVIGDFETYITKFLTRVNSYTGVAYKDDPTIIAWETGNELGGYINAEVWPPASWTTAIIAWIRKYDTKHLIIDGTNGFWNYTTGATSPGLNISGVDIVSDHGYPRNTGIITKELALAKAARKSFLIGEYDWTTQSSTSLATYLKLIESWKPLVGDMFWSLQGRDPQCCNFIKHGDGYSMYYPNGGTTAETANMLLVAQHWYRMTNRTPPTQLVGVTCPQPVF